MEQIKIDIVPVGVAPVAHASQFDNSRQIRFNLFNQGTPYTLTGAETVTMVVNGEEENITNTSDNYVIWDVAEEDCAEAGVIGCEIRIVLGSMLIGSKNFFLEVEMDPYNGKNIRTITVGPADICTFETTLPEPLQSVIVNINATGGNGTPDNPIPINGYTEANITRCGVNLWDEEWEVGGIDDITGQNYVKADRIRSKNFIPIKSSETYYLSMPSNGVWIYCYDINKTYISSRFIRYANNTFNFTLFPNAVYIRFEAFSEYGTTYNNDISINYPSSDTTYHAYNGQTYTIAFGQTVYGGVLDVTRGKLTVTHGGSDLSTLNWTASTYGYRTADLASDVKAPATDNIKADIISEAYNPVARNNIGSQGDNNIAISTAGNILVSSNSTPTGYAVYELATPFDIDLTPEVISAIVGTNNVFADCGETEVEYLTEG